MEEFPIPVIAVGDWTADSDLHQMFIQYNHIPDSIFTLEIVIARLIEAKSALNKRDIENAKKVKLILKSVMLLHLGKIVLKGEQNSADLKVITSVCAAITPILPPEVKPTYIKSVLAELGITHDPYYFWELAQQNLPGGRMARYFFASKSSSKKRVK